MPDQETIGRVRQDAEEGKSPSTQAGEFVRGGIRHVRGEAWCGQFQVGVMGFGIRGREIGRCFVSTG